MPTEPIQRVLAILEVSLCLAGVWLLWYLLTRPLSRQRWLNTNHLPHWPVSLAEFLAFLLLLMGCGFLVQAAAQIGLGALVKQAGDQAGLEVLVFGGSFHGGALLGWVLFPLLRRSWYSNYDATLPSPEPVSSTVWPWARVGATAGATVALSLPVLGLLSYTWTELLQFFGQNPTPQDLLAIFAQTRSPFVIVGMLVLACVIGPLNEELLFRAGLYRYIRQTLGRHWALLISGGIFGLVHGNLAGFLPLAAFGAILALAYEATGSLRVVVVAHGLFNLNTILLLLSGLAPGP